MEVVISLDDKRLKHYLGNCSENYEYMYLGERKENISQILNEHSFKEISVNDLAPPLKERLLKSYNDLIGKLGLKYNSIYWWATFTSAKNLLTSKLLSNLSPFYLVANRLREKPERNVLVINPSAETCSSIANYCLMNSVELKILSHPLHGLARVMRQILIGGITQVLFIYEIWQKIHISNKYLGNKLVSQDKQKGKYYVLRSWLYARSFDENNKYQDAFFGVLPDYLIKKGQKLLIVGGIIGDYESIVRSMASNNEYLIIPQEYFIRYVDPIKAMVNTYLHKIKIKEKIDLDGLDITSIIKSEVSNYKSITREYLYTYYIRRMLDLIDVDTFTTTYENNPWEKMCFDTLKKYSPETKTIGYQHVPLSKAHLGMFMTKYEKEVIPMPDKVNTIGKITKELLQKQGNYEKGKVKASCALRFNILPALEMVRRKKSNRILVALRGEFSLATRLTNFVYQGLKDNGQYEIIIRPHPVLPFERFENGLTFDVSSSPNFSISDTTSLKEELQKVDVVIYEGSAVAVEALAMGIPIILVDLNELVRWDSLFQCDYFRWIVDREEDLQETIGNIYRLSDDEYYHQQAEARRYLEDYAYAVTDKRLKEFIV